VHETTVTLETPDGAMDAFLAAPETKTRGPAVVVVMEAFGVNAHVKEVCRRFAREGFTAIAPDLFHRSGRGLTFDYGDFTKIRPLFGRLTNDGIATDLAAALAHVRGLPSVERRRVGVVGFCVGGFSTVLMACRTDVSSAVAFYGGGIVNERPGLALRPVLPEAAKISAPILLFFGGKDAHIPASDVLAIRERLAALGKKHEVHVYERADHGFFCDERASYEPEAAADAWRRTLDWFAKTLA
jgi:carboxymethylenebutenolidase